MLTFPPALDLPVHRLAASFNNTSATYKFYWLLALLDAVLLPDRLSFTSTAM